MDSNKKWLFLQDFSTILKVILLRKRREVIPSDPICMFSLLNNALEDLGLELSAKYLMSNFEVAIRDSFLSTFPGIEAKGCAFHFAKAILSKVAKSRFKTDYQQCRNFSAFIRATLGLAYSPHPRMTEALRNFYFLAKKLTDCSFHPSTWNMFQHDVVTTNNSSRIQLLVGELEENLLTSKFLPVCRDCDCMG